MEKKAMNGFVLKAYTNLYKKGKNIDIEKIKKKNNVKKDDIVDQIYFPSTNKLKKEEKSYFHPFLAD
jgi:hypothetical protein